MDTLIGGTGERRLFRQDFTRFQEIETLLDSEMLDAIPRERLHGYVKSEVLPKAFELQDEVVIENLFGMAVGHPNPVVRRALIDVVQSWLPHPMAVDTLGALIRDPDDMVCLKAIALSGEERVEFVLPYLTTICHWPTTTMHTPYKPVGMGAAHVQAALIKIMGTSNQAELAALSLYYEENGRLPETLETRFYAIPAEVEAGFRTPAAPGMVLIPASSFQYGLPSADVPDKSFQWTDSVPVRSVWLPSFFVDKHPVTNQEYDAFCDSVEENGHIFCHPQEPEGKIHRRNTYWDARFGPDHPVTAVDWFDAFAYARWAGKDLPTEYQWEKAARGPTGTIWPWGDAWDPAACNWAGHVFGRERFSIDQWREHLCTVTDEHPAHLTTPVKTFAVFASGYGVVDMVGNAWEWTKTDSRTGQFFTPSSQSRSTRAVSVVLRGGAWSSVPGMMYPSYRGQASPMCRHNEIGFRCVKNLPLRVFREAGLGRVRHSGIY